MPAAIAQFTITDYNDITVGATAPASPSLNQLWMNTSVTPNRLSRWSGSAWVLATPTTAANVGAEASIYKQAAAPAHSNGRLWLQTGVVPNVLYRSTGTVWEKVTPTTPSEVGAYPKTEGENLEERVTTAEQKITSDAIKTTVETEVSANGSTILATKSDITQNDNAWTAKFQSSGGSNLVKNGDFKDGLKFYSTYYVSGGGYTIIKQNNEWTGYEDGIEMLKSTSGGTLVVATTVGGFTPGKQYTVASLMAAHRGGGQLTVINKADNTVIASSQRMDNLNGASVLADWGLLSATFIATDDVMHIRLNLFSTGVNTYNWYKKLRVYEGSSVLPYAPHASELYDGVTKIDQDGINISRSTSEINTQLSHSGIDVKDGFNSIASFGEAGAFVPTLKSNVLNLTASKGGTYNVGDGHPYSTISAVLNDIFPDDTKVYIGGDINIRVYKNLSETINLAGIQGSGRLIIYFHNTTFNGNWDLVGCTLPIYIVNGAGGSVLKNPGNVSGYMFQVRACRYVQVSGLNLDNNGGYYNSRVDWGAHMQINNCDIVRANYAIEASNGSFITMVGCRGNLTSGILRLMEGSKAFLSGTRPVGALEYSTNKFVFLDNVSELGSAYSPPPVTSQIFTQVFTTATFDTLQYGTSNVDSYYGASACQNRWDSSMGWKQGRIRMANEVYNFYNGGSAITVKVRLRRKNTSHGNSGTVLPAGIGTFATGALRGGWTSWATVSSALFGSGGADLRLYNGVSGANGYAIWDAIEVEVTVTKNV